MHTRFLCLIYTSGKRYLETICNLFSLPTHLVSFTVYHYNVQVSIAQEPNQIRGGLLNMRIEGEKDSMDVKIYGGYVLLFVLLFFWLFSLPFYSLSLPLEFHDETFILCITLVNRLRLKKCSILFFQSVRSSYLNFKLIINLECVLGEDFWNSLWLESDFIFSEQFSFLIVICTHSNSFAFLRFVFRLHFLSLSLSSFSQLLKM